MKQNTIKLPKKLTMAIFIILPLLGCAQNQANQTIKVKSDSIINLFEKTLKNIESPKYELTKNPNNFFVDQTNASTDTIWLENYENFKYYKKAQNNNLIRIDYFEGKIGSLSETTQFVYYFNKTDSIDVKLIMTCSYYFRHGEELEDYGYSLYEEERRMIFNNNGKPIGYITRDCEGSSKSIAIDQMQFKAIDPTKVFYGKGDFETRGYMLVEGKTDF